MLGVLKVSVQGLREMVDPFSCDVWSCGEILTKGEVAQSVHSRNYKVEPYSHPGQCGEPWSHLDHASRVAYFVVFGWCEPIQVDVGVPDLGFMPQWPVSDGNHRLAAAIFAGLQVIDAEVSGDCELISQILAGSEEDDE
jgi:hypothetical protein